VACIFCGSKENLTDEHIFPAFMGGELKVPNGSCERCNREYSIAEAALKQATIPLLNVLQIENRDGVVPNAPLSAQILGLDLKNLPAFMDGEGEIRLKDVVKNSITAEGRNIRQGFFITKEGVDTFTERGRKRGDELIERKVPEKIVIDANYTQSTSFAFSLEARKIAAKIALAAIAYQFGISFALSAQFDGLRQMRAAKDLRVWIFANDGLMSDHPRTAHQHSVMCYLSAGMRKGWAVITLFGGLTYRVDLTADYTERESRQFSIFYDAGSKKRVNPIVLYDEMTLLGHVLSPASKFEDRDAVDAQWYPIVSAFCAQKGLIVEHLDGKDSL
jgi:hypothetical protein